MSIQQSLEKWQKEIGGCAESIYDLTSMMENTAHSMTAFEYKSKLMPKMYSQTKIKQTGWEHAAVDLSMSIRKLTSLEDEGTLYIPPGVHEAYAKLIKLAEDKKWDEQKMDASYSTILNYLLDDAPKQVAEKCIKPVVEK